MKTEIPRFQHSRNCDIDEAMKDTQLMPYVDDYFNRRYVTSGWPRLYGLAQSGNKEKIVQEILQAIKKDDDDCPSAHMPSELSHEFFDSHGISYGGIGINPDNCTFGCYPRYIDMCVFGAKVAEQVNDQKAARRLYQRAQRLLENVDYSEKGRWKSVRGLHVSQLDEKGKQLRKLAVQYDVRRRAVRKGLGLEKEVDCGVGLVNDYSPLDSKDKSIEQDPVYQKLYVAGNFGGWVISRDIDELMELLKTRKMDESTYYSILYGMNKAVNDAMKRREKQEVGSEGEEKNENN